MPAAVWKCELSDLWNASEQMGTLRFHPFWLLFAMRMKRQMRELISIGQMDIQHLHRLSTSATVMLKTSKQEWPCFERICHVMSLQPVRASERTRQGVPAQVDEHQGHLGPVAGQRPWEQQHISSAEVLTQILHPNNGFPTETDDAQF